MSRTTLADLAREYRCTTRTLTRARARGVNVHNPAELAAYVAGLRAPSTEMMRAIASKLAVVPPIMAGRAASQPLS